MAKTPLCPPKPKLFIIALSTLAWTALFGTVNTIPGVRGVEIYPCCIDRANRFDVMIVLEMKRVPGALLIGVLNNGLNLLGVSSFYQQVIKGAVILLAVLLDRAGKK